jgi:cell division protein FtsA
MDAKQNGKNEIVIYVGTRKLVALAGSLRNGEPRIHRYALQLDPQGFSGGLVTNLERAAASLEALVASLSSLPGIQPLESSDFVDVHVVLGNAKLRAHTFSSSEYFQGARRTVSPYEIRSVIEQTRSVATLPLSESIVQSLPDSFIVNDLRDVTNPLGMEAQRLGVSLRIFTMEGQDFRNLAKAFEAAELEVKGWWPRMLTASEAALTRAEKEEGALLADLGAGAGFLSLWKKGKFIQARVLDGGTSALSAELANLWQVDFLDAAKVWKQYGSLEKSPAYGEELIPLVLRNHQGTNHIQRQVFHGQFVQAFKGWIEKILAQADEFSREEKIFHPHLIFTGEGAALDGFAEFFQREFSRDVRTACTRGIEAPNELLVDPSMTPALGMYHWLSEEAGELDRLTEPQGFFYKTFTAARDWLSTYF